MNYSKLTEALKLIKETCKNSKDCDKCPFYSSTECMITYDNPSDWNIIEPTIKLMGIGE